ncbi:hypothetical protein WA158_002786 [Blastocystis sp. Blastoise]
MSSDNENLNLKSDEELLNTTEDEQEEVNDSQKESNIEDSNLAEDEIDAGSDIDDDDDENQQDDGIEDDIDIGNDVDDDDDNDDESQQDDGIEDDINWDEADEDENEHENENVDDRFAEKFSDDDNDTDINNIDEETLKEEIQIEKGKQRKVFDNITPLTEEEINEYNDKVNKTGLYMSHVPPYMRPYKVRILLSPFGEIGHMHFVEEDAALRRRRIRNGGNKKMKYTEGWIEFLNKKDAKKCASLLNGNVVGGKKLNFFHDDIWTLKYLKGFKWNNLVEKIAYEKRIRQDRLKTEFSQSRKADELYLENVEESKIYKKIQNKKNQKRNTNDMDNNNDDIHIKRVFKQKPTVQKDDSKQNKE